MAFVSVMTRGNRALPPTQYILNTAHIVHIRRAEPGQTTWEEGAIITLDASSVAAPTTLEIGGTQIDHLLNLLMPD
uniref:Uncharacterized protein n=1 Tax=viral metagenome TaxID=1070528 RepID=A0A6H1ZFW4_9ZZZZ